jgi:hypothetical protein
MTFAKWASTSLIGHVVLFELTFSIPMSFLMIYLNYVEGTLTASWALWLFFVSALLGSVGAGAIWYTITLPLIKRQKRKLTPPARRAS